MTPAERKSAREAIVRDINDEDTTRAESIPLLTKALDALDERDTLLREAERVLCAHEFGYAQGDCGYIMAPCRSCNDEEFPKLPVAAHAPDCAHQAIVAKIRATLGE